MSELYDMGLRPGRCNGCDLKRLKHELGDKFLMLSGTIYKLDTEPAQGQGTPTNYKGRPIRFIMWGMDYGHSDECYHWSPPRKSK